MNNLIKNILIVATSILYLTSCQNNIDELETIVPKKVITIHADTNNARTYIADEFKGVIIWSENDQLKVIENALSYSNTSDISIDDNGKAKFTVSFASNTNTSEFTYNAIFPASSVIEDTKINIEKVKVVVMNEQNPTETSFDPMADILVAKQIVSNCQPSEINMQFKRLVSIGKLTLKNLPADCKIHQVIFTAGDEDILAGRNYINTSIGEVVRYGYNNSTNTITMNYSSAISTRDIYFTCNPFEMNEDEVFSIVVVCDGTTYTRNVTIPKGQSLIFTEGNMASFTVDMENATTENNELSSKLNLPIIRWNTTKSSILQEMGNREPLHSDDTTLVYSGTGIEEIIAYSFNDDKLETSIAYIPSDKITLNDISDLFGEYKKIDEHNGFFNSENSTFANITSDGGYYCIGWTICKQEEISSAKNKIWYTNGSTTEATTPSNVDSIDANIISNIYDSNKECWVMTFDDNITIIDFGAFGNCDNLKTITLPNGIIRIGQNAFSGCDNLTSITIPDSVTLIGDGAFSGCDNLTSITIPDSVTQIGDEAFNRCSSLAEFKGKFASSDNRCLIVEGVLKSFAPSGLTEYTIPDGTTSIGKYAFNACENLTRVTIPESVCTIGIKAFYLCSGLKEVYCPSLPPVCSSYAFSYNASNRKFYIYEECIDAYKNADSWKDYIDSFVTNGHITTNQTTTIYYTTTNGEVIEPALPIKSNSYSNGLGTLVVYGQLTNIPNNSFEGCNLTSITIPDSVTQIGDGAFNRCSSLAEFKGKFASSDNRCLIVEGVLKSFAPSGLTEYTIPDGTTSIGNEAFRMCKNLTSVTIPDSVTDIGVKAFLACTNLTSVTIPDSVTYIGERAFYECTNLTSVTISKNASSIGDYAFYECTNLTSVTIPDSVTYIGKCAFNTCTNLTSVTISKNASSIGMSAFFDCTNLKNVYCKALTPPLLGISVFQYFNQRYNLVDIGCTIYVPVESVSAYKTAVNWKDYRAYIIGYEF